MSLSKTKTIFARAIYLALCFNLFCDAFIRQLRVERSIRSHRHVVSYEKFPSSFDGVSTALIGYRHNKNVAKSKLLQTSYGVKIDDAKVTRQGWLRFPLLERSHERFIFLLFGVVTAVILYFAGFHSQTEGLPPFSPGKWLIMAETGVTLTWSSMILAISFLEAWTKFRAPFLKKYIAVDVGRHVFAAFNSAELGIVSSLWLHRAFQCYQVQKICGGELLYKSRSYYEQSTFTLPAAATLSLLLQVLIIAPKLYTRAKRKILDGFDEALPSIKISMTKEEQRALNDIALDFRCHRRIPSRLWHSLYGLLEIVKMGCLNAFVILSWFNVLQ